jgi:hypothetical protein
MSRIDGIKSRNDNFLDALAGELEELPIGELLDRDGVQEALETAGRALNGSKAEAGRRRRRSSGTGAADAPARPLEEAGSLKDEPAGE